MSNNQQRFVVTCPGCQNTFAARANIRGKCPQCKTEMIIDANGIASLPPAPAPTSLDALLVEDLVAGDPLASGPLAPVRHRPTSSANDGLYIKLAIGGGVIGCLFVILMLVNVFSSTPEQVTEKPEEPKQAAEVQQPPQDRIVNEVTVDVVNNMPEESSTKEEVTEEVPEKPQPEALAEPESPEPEKVGPKPITCSVEEWASVNPSEYSKEDLGHLYMAAMRASNNKHLDLSFFFMKEAVKKCDSICELIRSYDESKKIPVSQSVDFAKRYSAEIHMLNYYADYGNGSGLDDGEILRCRKIVCYACPSYGYVRGLAFTYGDQCDDYVNARLWGECALRMVELGTSPESIKRQQRQFINSQFEKWRKKAEGNEEKKKNEITRYCIEWGDAKLVGYAVAAKFVDVHHKPYAYLVQTKEGLFEVDATEISDERFGDVFSLEPILVPRFGTYYKLENKEVVEDRAKFQMRDWHLMQPKTHHINGRSITIDPNDLRRGAEYWESYPLKK